jgi:hypothetical protein
MFSTQAIYDPNLGTRDRAREERLAQREGGPVFEVLTDRWLKLCSGKCHKVHTV